MTLPPEASDADPVDAPDEKAPASASWTGQIGDPVRILLLRHGQTELSVGKRYSGHGDPELTQLGHEMAAAAALRLAATEPAIAAIVVSPLRRARQTAAAVAEAVDAPLQVHDGLIETNFGAWEGLTFAEARARDPELHARWLGHDDVAPPGGESFAQVAERITAVRKELVEQFTGQTLLVVSHVTPIKMFLRDALQGGPEILYRMHLDLAGLSEASFYPDGGASVRLVNDTSHHPPTR